MGRAMAQAVSRWPLTAKTRVRSWVSPCGIFGGKSGTGQVFPLVLRFSPVNSIPPVLHYKKQRKNYSSTSQGLHNKPQGCGASVASAAGPFKEREREKKDILIQPMLSFLCTPIDLMLSWTLKFHCHCCIK